MDWDVNEAVYIRQNQQEKGNTSCYGLCLGGPPKLHAIMKVAESSICDWVASCLALVV